MVDLPATQEPADAQVYRPICGLALTGFVLSALFCGMVLVTTLVALVQGMPVFLPGWALAFALVAAVICVLAQVRIRNAEGTLAGLALARWGLWPSVLLGATYFVYTWVTGLAITKQANDFLMVKADEDSGFFPRLVNARKNRTDLYQAFLLTLPATARGGSKAENEERMLSQYDQPSPEGEPGNISKFRRNPLVLALTNNPEKIAVEPLAVVDWKYESKTKCYNVVRNYRFTTPEAIFEANIPAQSTEGSVEGEQRKWFVPLVTMQRVQAMKPTLLGENLALLRYHSKSFLDRWVMELTKGTPAPEYKESDTDWEKIVPKKQTRRDHVKNMVGEIFRAERKVPGQMLILTDDNFVEWSEADGRIQMSHPMKTMLPASGDSPNISLELDLVVATREPVNLTVPITMPPAWEIRQVRVTRASPAVKKGPPGPGAGPR